MSGAIPLLTVYAFMPWTRNKLPFILYVACEQKYVNSHMYISACHWPLRIEVGIWHSAVIPRRAFTDDVTQTRRQTHLRRCRPRDQFAVALSLEDQGLVSRDAILDLTFLLSFVPTSLLQTHLVICFGTIKSENLLTSWTTTSFSRRILLRGVSHLYCLRPFVLDEALKWKYRLCCTTIFYYYHVCTLWI